MAPYYRWLAVAAVTPPVLWVLAAAAAVVADAVTPVVRMRPIDIWGTYTTSHDFAGGGCPPNFTLGQGEPFSAADGITDRPPHANLALNFLGTALSEGGVPCSAGALVGVVSIETFSPAIMEAAGVPNETALIHASSFSSRMVHWADVVGLGVGTIPCGATAPRWGTDTWVAFGEMEWSVAYTPPGEGPLTVSIGGTNRTAIFLHSTGISCIMKAPPRRGLAAPPPAGEGVGDDGEAADSPARAEDEGGGGASGVSAGAAAGIGLAAAAVGLALGAAGGLSASRVRRRRHFRSGLVGHKPPAADAAAGVVAGAAGGTGATPPSRPHFPRVGTASKTPVVGLALPMYGESGGGVDATAAAAKDLREAFGLADAPPMPPELADSMAPPPMPDALRGSTISDPSTGARSGRS